MTYIWFHCSLHLTVPFSAPALCYPTPCPTAPTETPQTLPFPLAQSKLHYSWGLHTLLDKNVLLLLSTETSFTDRGQKKLFLLLHMVDPDIGSLSSFISRAPTDFKKRAVHLGREEHWSQDPPMQIWRQFSLARKSNTETSKVWHRVILTWLGVSDVKSKKLA